MLTDTEANTSLCNLLVPGAQGAPVELGCRLSSCCGAHTLLRRCVLMCACRRRCHRCFSCSYYSAFTTQSRLTALALAMGESAPLGASTLVKRGEYAPAAMAFGLTFGKMAAVYLLVYIGGIWLSSGFHGQ